jgi:hypothetical protein
VSESCLLETLEIFLSFRAVEADCPFEPRPGKVDVPLHSTTIEIKHSEIVHRLGIAKTSRLLK